LKLIFSGPMASGKSTVARAAAERLGVPVVDVDAVIEARAGKSVTEIFAGRGEAEFRAMEREETRRALALPGDGVIALGGGAVTDDVLRRELIQRGTLIGLRAPLVELQRRAALASGTRPLLAATPLAEIIERRRDVYAECHAVVDTGGRTLEAIADEAIRVSREERIVVALGRRTYRIEIGPGVRSRVVERAREVARGDAVVVVTDRSVATPWADEAAQALGVVRRIARVVLEPGEEQKHLGSVEAIWDAALGLGVDRDALIVGIGGGVIGDLAGFAASTLLRGVALGHVPTTVVAMADSAVGGKTAIDREQGKNLVGTFHQPSFVLCDPEVLRTLPERERRSGLAEVVKAAWIAGEAEVAALEADATALAAGDLAATARALRMAVGLKARIVAADEREDGPRALLNLGHTLGHAIEAAAGYRGVRHGEAVAIGMVAAAGVGTAIGLAPREGRIRMARLLATLGLPVDPTPHRDARTLSFLGADKKRRGGRLRYVVPVAPGDVRIVPLELEEIGEMLGRTDLAQP
jgi:shikimate kinase/3-dehydroquinate synthase